MDSIFTLYMLPLTDPENIFIVIPAYNEQEIIGSVVDELLKYRFPVVLVDDGSQPGLSPAVKNKAVYYLKHCVNLGQGAAIQTGIEFALSKGAVFIATFDADGQHDPGDIQKMLAHLVNNKLDIVLGSRFAAAASANMTNGRKLVLQVARFINYIFTGVLLTDAHNGLRVMTRAAAEKIRLKENRMSHATEFLSIIKQFRLNYAEVPVRICYTDYSRRKGQSLWDSFRIFFDLLLNKVFK